MPIRTSLTIACTLCATLILASTTTLRPTASTVVHSAAVGHVDDANDALRDPCVDAMRQPAPATFEITFGINYGHFTATCERATAPIWVDRVYNLARLGYYSDNYFLRVVNTEHLKIVQFGTAGDPSISNVYNWSTTTSKCAILEPQPPAMPYCLGSPPVAGSVCPPGVAGLSNTFGTLAMSTSGTTTPAFPGGVTWNATAELFINTGDNSWLDAQLFVPLCRIDAAGMASVLRLPSFGELAELGGPGPSLGRLYAEGNRYIESNASWSAMGKASSVRVSAKPTR